MHPSFHLIRPYLKENRLQIIAGLFCLIAVDFLQLFIPRIIKRAVDGLTTFGIDTGVLARYAIYILVIGLLIFILRFFWRRFLIGLSRKVEEGLRNRLFSHLQLLSAPYFSRTRTGDLMAHATNDIMNIRMATGMGMVALTDAVVLGTAAVGFMAYINVRLTLLALIPMPLIAFSARFFGRKLHRRYQEVQGSFSRLTETARESFAGIRISKAYGLEEDTAARFHEDSSEYIHKNLNLVRITGSFYPMMMFFANLSLALVLWFGGRQTIGMIISPGDFVAFINYLALLTWPMMALGWVTNLIQRGAASLDRIRVILESVPEVRDPSHARPLGKAAGALTFENVSFAYAGRGKEAPSMALAGISLEVPPGGILGITGPPGGGKTTLLSLIPRLFDVAAGRILLEGTDIRSLRLEDLRSRLAFMPQEPFLFSGTIRENITFQAAGDDETAIFEAARAASLHDTVKGFPRGFDTLVGEKGVMLSGGQKQRLALARMLYAVFTQNPPVLLLDDPISQVDVETGNAIMRALRDIARGCTLLIVSHRLSAIQFADQIVVLENGRITEMGTHEALLAQDRYYARTHALQEIEEGFNAN